MKIYQSGCDNNIFVFCALRYLSVFLLWLVTPQPAQLELLLPSVLVAIMDMAVAAATITQLQHHHMDVRRKNQISSKICVVCDQIREIVKFNGKLDV